MPQETFIYFTLVLLQWVRTTEIKYNKCLRSIYYIVFYFMLDVPTAWPTPSIALPLFRCRSNLLNK